ncbi:10581_t:CDS:2 [Dentiscutata erythropus]|uniref:10581_t:CDS:1 n=1 Tax=Dentiscutata erythropus TaxID=1348616 RepID=A0A9N9ED02_9GLOM|nr:10581_t:CDS:2 [Dentiscutata erythropus]
MTKTTNTQEQRRRQGQQNIPYNDVPSLSCEDIPDPSNDNFLKLTILGTEAKNVPSEFPTRRFLIMVECLVGILLKSFSISLSQSSLVMILL